MQVDNVVGNQGVRDSDMGLIVLSLSSHIQKIEFFSGFDNSVKLLHCHCRDFWSKEKF